jgi:hypothetical protein
MKKILLLIAVILCSYAYGEITCVSNAGGCPAGFYTEIFRLSSPTNAHVDTTGVYSTYLCCGDAATNYGIANSALGVWDDIINISATTNAHASRSGLSGYGNQQVMGTNSGIYHINCTLNVSGDCNNPIPSKPLQGSPPWECTVKLSGLTNAHVSDCTDLSYPVSVCCSACQDADQWQASCVNCLNMNWTPLVSFENSGSTTFPSCCGDDPNEYYYDDPSTPCSACCNETIDMCYINTTGDSACGNVWGALFGNVVEQQVNNPTSFQASNGAKIEVKYRVTRINLKRTFTNAAGNYNVLLPAIPDAMYMVVSKPGYDTVTVDIPGAPFEQNITLMLTNECRTDCSRLVVDKSVQELRCDAACDGINGCVFPNAFSVDKGALLKDLCDEKIIGWETQFNSTDPRGEFIATCCNSTPRLKVSMPVDVQAPDSDNVFTMSSAGYMYKGKPVVIYVTSWD